MVDEFCSDLKTLAKNCDLGHKEYSWITSMFVLGLEDPRGFKGKADRERTEFREKVTNCSYCRNNGFAGEGGNGYFMSNVSSQPAARDSTSS